MKKKICVVTGSRADYGLLYWLLSDLKSHPRLQLQLAVTGMHASPEFGMTIRQIEQDGFVPDEVVEMLVSSDTAVGVTKSIGLGVIGFADALARLRPDLLVVLGDRFEILAAAQAALIARVPIAHISGGDTTEGAFDEAIRHSLTKMSSIHFATNAEAAARIKQMGEDPQHVLNVGSPGIDYIRRVQLLSKSELEKELGMRLAERSLLITYHPETLGTVSPGEQFQEVLAAAESWRAKRTSLVFTKPNSDTGGREIIRLLEEYRAGKPDVFVFSSLGQRLYLSVMSVVDAIVGNSSSGLLEMPSFGRATVNIGDRQKGRLRAKSVLDCDAKRETIVATIQQALSADFRGIENPYGDGHSTERILTCLENVEDFEALTRKKFYSYGA
jgi:UDP-hydrolysing UDP-N-acetyl-D-glucosamine 2-epimerase